MAKPSNSAEFVQFHLLSGQPVAVNPLQVRYVVASDSPAGTGLYFTDQQAVFVSEPFDQVLQLLKLP